MAVDVAVCRKCKHHRCVTDVLESHGDASVTMVRCQKICNGPVVGLPVAGRMEWFERVDGRKSLAGLALLTEQGHRDAIPKALRKRRVKKRAGRPVRT